MGEADDLDAIRARKREALRERTAGRDPDASEQGGAAPAPDEPVHVERPADLDRLAAEHPVVLADFHADWCGPCQLLDPTVRKLARNTDAVVAKVDVDALPALARTHHVRGVPTLVCFAGGEPVERLVGVQDYGTLESLVEQHA